MPRHLATMAYGLCNRWATWYGIRSEVVGELGSE